MAKHFLTSNALPIAKNISTSFTVIAGLSFLTVVLHSNSFAQISFSLFSLPEWTQGPTVPCHSSITLSYTWSLRTSSNFLINQSLFHAVNSVSNDGAVPECWHHPWHWEGRVRREGDDKFTATGALESNRSLTNDNQATQLSAFSEVKSETNRKAVCEMRQ